eukprot:gnl/MRDRNA2_/MRDRNA2_367456_c0_seq1.p1 gnl/MRDRNA2_/MRDRNA2_367456_c0~~gnl/MRDRNA2_/MRDRNA2_367456_c0_seq1.p1  ORF type:complete len:160 (-),score=39.06 gnl/MRDRNA2_/MRDRNA2_367456_c0_seq1:83-505(-)
MLDDKIEQIFAYCDTDGSGCMSKVELEEAWDFLLKQLIEQAMITLGCSNVDIIATVILTVGSLACLFAFVCLALQGWYAESSFDAVVQTALVSGMGKLVTVYRNKAKGESGDADTLIAEMSEADGENDGDGDPSTEMATE